MARADADADRMATMAKANDKLLKALITLLALKDDHLLGEMRAVFFVARRDDNPIGKADRETWAHIRQELTMITELIESEEDEEVSYGAADALLAN